MKKVAAYCRVSTDSSDQTNSLASQEKYFSEYINRNPEWELAQVFVDTGISGTTTKKRAAFNQMIQDAVAGKFNLILTKEISRFARNTLDSIYYTRKLKEHGVGVIFMNDNINTLDPDAELRLTIMSSIAQEESRKISDRVKWGQKRRMEQGIVFGRDMLGYDVRNGRLYINEKGAEIVRLIFHKFVNEDKGTHVIARELREEGIPTSTYMKQWSNTVILRVIRNEKYAGHLIQKKTITPSYLNHQKKCNKGEEEFVVLHNHHEPIISSDLFDRAQRELERRSPSTEQKAKHSNRYCFSGKIKCEACGNSFVSRTKKRKNKTLYKAWRCYSAANHGAKHTDINGNEVGCNCPSLNDDDLKCIMQKILESLLVDKTTLINKVGAVIEEVIREEKSPDRSDGAEVKIEDLTNKKQSLIELYLAKEITKTEFQKIKEKYEEDITVLRKSQVTMSENNSLQENHQAVLDDIQTFITSLVMGVSWDDVFYRNIIDRISVAKDNTLTVSLNPLPYKWNVKLQNASTHRHYESSQPISVKSPATSL